MAALHAYQRTAGDRVTVEYALFKDVNDSADDARELVRLLHGLHSYVNLIPGNANPGGYETSPGQNVLRFQSVLKSAGFESEIRTTRGGHINAACGQLRNSSRGPVPVKPVPAEQEKPAVRPVKKYDAAKRKPLRENQANKNLTRENPARKNPGPAAGKPPRRAVLRNEDTKRGRR
jgi:23S rRNA (adenine2503-C2)-methyltransferase